MVHNSKIETHVQDVEYILNRYNDEDLIWLLHLFYLSKEDIKKLNPVDLHDREVLKNDVEKINSIKDLKEIKDYIQLQLKDDPRLEYEFIENINSNLKKIQARELFSKIKKNDIRSLLCILYLLKNNSNDDLEDIVYNITHKNKSHIENIYHRFLFILSVDLDQDNVIHDFNKALDKYIKLSALHPNHFESGKIDYDEDFYRWAFNYISTKDDFNRKLKYLNISHCDFKTQVNLFFDILYFNDINLYENFIGKVKNAWYQRLHQKKKANKKKYQFILSDKTLNELEHLKYRFDSSQEKIIERLIAAEYVKECLNAEGKPKHTFND